jgi:hypothetical protein
MARATPGQASKWQEREASCHLQSGAELRGSRACNPATIITHTLGDLQSVISCLHHAFLYVH